MIKEKILVVGFGGHAKSIIDSILSQDTYDISGYTDVTDKADSKLKYLGDDSNFKSIYENLGVTKAVIGIGFLGKSTLRNKIYLQLKSIGYELPCIIDPSAIVARDAKIGEGTFIGKKATVNSNSEIGLCNIINTGAIVEHDNRIGDFSHISVGSVLCGNVSVGNNSFIGANSTVIQGVSVGNNVIVGASSVVLKSIQDNVTAYGVINNINNTLGGIGFIYIILLINLFLFNLNFILRLCLQRKVAGEFFYYG